MIEITEFEYYTFIIIITILFIWAFIASTVLIFNWINDEHPEWNPHKPFSERWADFCAKSKAAFYVYLRYYRSRVSEKITAELSRKEAERTRSIYLMQYENLAIHLYRILRKRSEELGLKQPVVPDELVTANRIIEYNGVICMHYQAEVTGYDISEKVIARVLRNNIPNYTNLNFDVAVICDLNHGAHILVKKASTAVHRNAKRG